MKNKWISVFSAVLVVAILLGMVAMIGGSDRRQPHNPITPREDSLQPDVWDSSDLLNTPQENNEPKPEEETKPEDATEPNEETKPAEEAKPSENEPEETTPGDSQTDDPGHTPTDEENPGNAGDSQGDDEPTEPVIVTNLGQFTTVTEAQLSDGVLSFYAYGAGADDLSVRVNVKPKSSITTGTWLNTENEKDYAWKLELGTTYSFTVYLYQKDNRISYAVFHVTWQAQLADENNPSVGPEPLVIKTNLDTYGSEVKSENLPLIVTVYRNEKLENRVTADKIRVTLNGETVEKHGGDSSPEYDLYFKRPNVGDEKEYKIEIVAWYGVNSRYWSKTLTYRAAAEGDPIGFATVVLDATTVGCGILDSETYEIVQGETAAETVLRFLEEFGYDPVYDGTAKNAFYLRKISRGDMCYDAAPNADLWDMILRDGINLNRDTHSRDGLGEYDYTMGSGWMYAVNGNYPGRAMSGYYLKDGDTLYLRFTLAYGKDIGGYDATGGGYGSLSSYCGLWIDGAYKPLGHRYAEIRRQEPTAEADGFTDEKCSQCGDEKHTVLPKKTVGE